MSTFLSQYLIFIKSAEKPPAFLMPTESLAPGLNNREADAMEDECCLLDAASLVIKKIQ